MKTKIEQIAGVPLDEALRVLAVYQTTGEAPHKDYYEGFMAGYTRAHAEVRTAIEKNIMPLLAEGRDKWS